MKDQNRDLLEWVIKPTLHALDMAGERAETLMLATVLAESEGRHTRQIGGGPALGLWQMEPETHDDIYTNYLLLHRQELQPKLKKASLYVFGGSFPPSADLLLYNPRYACAMARLKYWRVSEPLPDTVDGMAGYWKKYYNTPEGKGTEAKFRAAWKNK